MNKTEIVKEYLMNFSIIVVGCIIGIVLSPWLAWEIRDDIFFRKKGEK